MDQFWQVLRYFLIAGGSWLAGRGKIDPTQVAPMADAIIQAAGLVVAAGSAIWGIWVKYNTKSVPAATAARADVPTVSAATGAVQK